MKNLKPFEMFLWLSGSDPAIYQKCNTGTKWKRLSLSLFVLLTGVFSFISSSYFIRTIFQTYNEQTKTLEVGSGAWFISFIIGLIWAIFIINIERTIIASTQRWMAIPRLILAAAIGFVISVPLEIQMFSGKIHKSLIEASRNENKVYEDKYDEKTKSVNDEIKQLKTTITNEKAEVAKWKSVMEAETVGRVKAGLTGLAGQGPAYKEAEDNYSLHNGYVTQAQQELNALLVSSGIIESSAKKEYEDKKIDQSFDFTSQYQECQILKAKDNSLNTLGNSIILLFILIECIPAIIKLLNERDEFDMLIKARNYLNEQIINTLTNEALDEINKNKGNTLSGNSNSSQYQPKNFLPQITQTLI